MDTEDDQVMQLTRDDHTAHQAAQQSAYAHIYMLSEEEIFHQRGDDQHEQSQSDQPARSHSPHHSVTHHIFHKLQNVLQIHLYLDPVERLRQSLGSSDAIAGFQERACGRPIDLPRSPRCSIKPVARFLRADVHVTSSQNRC